MSAESRVAHGHVDHASQRLTVVCSEVGLPKRQHLVVEPESIGVAAQLAVALGRHREGARLSAAVAAWEQRYELPQDSTLWTHTLWTRQRLSLAREPDVLGRAPPHGAAR